MKAHAIARLLLEHPDYEVVFHDHYDGDYRIADNVEVEVLFVSQVPGLSSHENTVHVILLK